MRQSVKNKVERTGPILPILTPLHNFIISSFRSGHCLRIPFYQVTHPAWWPCLVPHKVCLYSLVIMTILFQGAKRGSFRKLPVVCSWARSPRHACTFLDSCVSVWMYATRSRPSFTTWWNSTSTIRAQWCVLLFWHVWPHPALMAVYLSLKFPPCSHTLAFAPSPSVNLRWRRELYDRQISKSTFGGSRSSLLKASSTNLTQANRGLMSWIAASRSI